MNAPNNFIKLICPYVCPDIETTVVVQFDKFLTILMLKTLSSLTIM